MCRLSCRRLLREHADVGRKKKGVPARSGWLPVLRNSKSWMRSLERLKGRYPGARMARKRERVKKFHFPQTGSTAKFTMRTGSTAQKVKTENPAALVLLVLMVCLKCMIAGHEGKFSSWCLSNHFQMQASVPPTALLVTVTVRNPASLTTVAVRMRARSPPLPQETTVEVTPPNLPQPAFRSSHSTNTSSSRWAS